MTTLYDLLYVGSKKQNNNYKTEQQTNKQTKNKLIDTDRLVFIRGGDCGSRNE